MCFDSSGSWTPDHIPFFKLSFLFIYFIYQNFQQQTEGLLKVGQFVKDIIICWQDVGKIWQLVQYHGPEGEMVGSGHREDLYLIRTMTFRRGTQPEGKGERGKNGPISLSSWPIGWTKVRAWGQDSPLILSWSTGQREKSSKKIMWGKYKIPSTAFR